MIEIIRSLKAFIDDVVLHVSNPTEDTLEELTNTAQNQLCWWDQLIQVTGGALNPKKCCRMLYHWTPDKRGILKLNKLEAPLPPITLPHVNSQQEVHLLNPSAGTRYLGLYLSTDQNTKTMEEHLWNKATLYTKAFHRTPMNRREAGVLYRSCFIPALTYPFPATWLPDTFFEKIHQLSTSTILNKMGYHRALPREMVFAPRSVGGIGLCHLQHEMEVQQILILLQHMRARTPLGTTIKILMRQYQLWAGIQQPILTNTQPCPWVPDKWISRL